MSETKLKPCPFCGGEAAIYADKFDKVTVWCERCGVKMGIELEDGCVLVNGWQATFETIEDAIKAWNERGSR